MPPDIAIPELLYHGRQMNPTPLGSSMDDVARALQGEHPVSAEIEPGDGTYYNVLIVPAWCEHVKEHLGRYGIPAEKAKDYLIVTKLTDADSPTFYAADDVGAWDMHGIENQWTRDVLVWWLRYLWLHIAEARGRSQRPVGQAIDLMTALKESLAKHPPVTNAE